MHKKLLEMYHKALGYEPQSWPKERKGAQRILALGFTPEQAMECYQHYKASRFWSDKHLSLTYIASNIEAWARENADTDDHVEDIHEWYRRHN